MTCFHCGAETSNGLALCQTCMTALRVDLEFIPVYFRNLARWRPSSASGTRSVPGSRMPTLPGSSGVDRIGNELDATGNDLVGWARVLEDDRGVPQPGAFDDEAAQVDALCALFTESLTSIATLDWCGDFAASVLAHEEALRRLTEAAVPGWYAGACRLCSVATFVVPGLTWVTCGGCGSTTYARDHLPTILAEARGWVARPKQIAGALVAMLDTETSVEKLHDRIRQWEHRTTEDKGGLIPVRKYDRDGDPIGPKKYRLGDVLDKLTNMKAER